MYTLFACRTYTHIYTHIHTHCNTNTLIVNLLLHVSQLESDLRCPAQRIRGQT